MMVYIPVVSKITIYIYSVYKQLRHTCMMFDLAIAWVIHCSYSLLYITYIRYMLYNAQSTCFFN